MAETNERVTDRRMLYTRSLIKSSLLELLKTHSFTSVSVTALAEQAGIGRNTFYRHFNNTFDVLEATIDDALNEIVTICGYLGIDSSKLSNLVVPSCEFFRGSTRYKILFTDADLSSLIIDRISSFDERRFVKEIAAFRSCSLKEAEALARFQAAGILEVCSTYANVKDEEWDGIVSALDEFIQTR